MNELAADVVYICAIMIMITLTTGLIAGVVIAFAECGNKRRNK